MEACEAGRCEKDKRAVIEILLDSVERKVGGANIDRFDISVARDELKIAEALIQDFPPPLEVWRVSPPGHL